MSGWCYDRRVVAYHGTDRATAQSVLSGADFKESANDHDWLGPGIYFWEYGPERAWEWAIAKYGDDAAVVGALIQLGRCYDLMDTRFTTDLGHGAKQIHELWERAGDPIPPNSGGNRALDCAIFTIWLDLLEQRERSFQTVRRAFEEGEAVYPGMAVTTKAHIQIAVRDPSCIIGVFQPRQA